MILYLDTETSGLRPGQICQLSYIMQTKDEIKAKNFFFAVSFVEYGALMVHGFTVEKLRRLSGGKTFCEQIDQIKADLSIADLVVAHNSSFDMMFLRAEFERVGQVLPVKNEFCSMKNTTAICKLPGKRAGYKYPKLNELTAKFNIQDCEIVDATKRLFKCDKGYHDARFDTTAVFLAMDIAMEQVEQLKFLKEFL